MAAPGPKQRRSSIHDATLSLTGFLARHILLESGFPQANTVIIVSKLYTTPLTPELCCTHIETSLPFYVDVLGFTVQYKRPEEGFAMLERQGSRLMLDQLRGVDGTGRAWLAGPLERPYGRGINLQMQTENVDALYAKVEESGATIFLPMEEKWYRCDDVYLGNRQFIVLDPDGYLLRFFEDLGEKKTL